MRALLCYSFLAARARLLFRSVVGLDRFSDDGARGVAVLEVLTLRGYRPRDVAGCGGYRHNPCQN